MRHVVVMTFSGVIAITMQYLVDLIDLFYLSLLHQTSVTSAIGYAGTIVLLNLSVAIGGSVAAATLVAKSIGAGNLQQAQEHATSALFFSLILSALLTIVIVLSSRSFLSLLGARDDAMELAQLFIRTMTPGFFFIGGEVCCIAILRAVGDARSSMWISVIAALITLCADPIFIFGFDLGIQGAAIATTLGQFIAFLIGLHRLKRAHKIINSFNLGELIRDFPKLKRIALPAILAQLTLPFSNSYVTYLMAGFGDEYVAGFIAICRIVPVAFGLTYSIMGSVGPIIGQNFGARMWDRVRQTITNSLIFSTGYVLITSLILFLLRFQIVEMFHASGNASSIIEFFCKYIAISWSFLGAQFLANSAFNQLGHSKLALAFSWARATLGTAPFAFLGAKFDGAEGVLIGNAIGAAIFGILAIIKVYSLVNDRSRDLKTGPTTKQRR